MNRGTLRWLSGLVLLGLIGTALALRGRVDAAALAAWVQGAGAAGPLVFIAIYAAATVLFLPGALVTLAGGEGLVQNILIALALVSALTFLPRFVRRLRTKPMLSVDALKRQLDDGDGVLVLDVRPAADFNGDWGHIPGARSVPLEELSARLAEFESDRHRPVRMVCRTDRRSAQAAPMLARAGFVDARVIQSGMTAWRAKGWPVVDARDQPERAR